MSGSASRIRRWNSAGSAAVALPRVIVEAGADGGGEVRGVLRGADRERADNQAAYPRAAGQFASWCEARGLRLEAVSPVHVAAYIRTHAGSAPTVKQHLAAIREPPRPGSRPEGRQEVLSSTRTPSPFAAAAANRTHRASPPVRRRPVGNIADPDIRPIITKQAASSSLYHTLSAIRSWCVIQMACAAPSSTVPLAGCRATEWHTVVSSWPGTATVLSRAMRSALDRVTPCASSAPAAPARLVEAFSRGDASPPWISGYRRRR